MKNKNDLTTYYNVGKMLSEAGKHYGESIIKEYSIKLTNELGKGYSTRSLKYMRKFYIFQKGQPMAAQLTWSHYQELLILKDVNEINYYIQKTIKFSLTKRQLREAIKNMEYQRLDEATKIRLVLKEKIKNELINNEVYKKVKDYSKNKNDLMTYYNVGKLLFKAGKHYGNGIIKQYSIKLVEEFSNAKYGYRNLFNMRKFYILFQNEKMNALRTQLSWTHYRELLVLKDMNEINYYIDISIKENLSYRELHNKIKSKEYQRLDKESYCY